MKIASILENQGSEKRIAITPEIAKKYISLGFEVYIFENYGGHLGILDEEYKELGVSILKDEKEIISSADIIVQLGLFDDDKSSLLKKNQTFIGVLNPYDNKDKIDNLVKNNINIFSLDKPILSFYLFWAGLMTLIPLFWYTKVFHLIGIGPASMIFFLTPTAQFLIGLYYYNEPLILDKLISFIFIWIAVIIYLNELRKE